MPVLISSGQGIGVQGPEQFVYLFDQAQSSIHVVGDAPADRPAPRTGTHFVDADFERHPRLRSLDCYRATEGVTFIALRVAGLKAAMLHFAFSEGSEMPSSVKCAKIDGIARFDGQHWREVA